MEWYLTIIIAYLSFWKASAVILEGPRSGTYHEGANVTLQCLAQGNNRIVWEDINENTVIFIDKAKNTQKAKFDNFFISKAEGNFSLTIVDAQLSDDGFYSCEEGDESRNANVTVEAGPTLSISLNDTLLASEHPVTLTEDEMIVVVCKAEGSKPAVDLRIKLGGDEWIQEVNVTKRKEGLRSTTEAKIVHHVANIDNKITCQTFGQSSIPPVTKVIHTDIRYKPKCQIDLDNGLAKCHCVSNPAVSTYKVYVDGELKGTDPTLPVEEYLPANITCQATNDVGTGRLASKFVTPAQVDDKDRTTIIIIIIFAVIAVCGCLVVVLVFWICHRKSSKNVPTGATPDQNDEEQKELIPIDGKESPEFQKFVSQIAETIHRDWEILAVEDLKLHRDEVKKIIEDEPECHEQVKLAIELWTEKTDEVVSKSNLASILSHSSVCNDTQCNECTVILQDIPSVILHYSQTADAMTSSSIENNAKETQKESPKIDLTESEEFKTLLQNVTKLVGHTGALKLSKEYEVDKKEENTNVKDLNIIGEDIITLLVKSGHLKHSIPSLKVFQEKLQHVSLFRASNLVGIFILQKEMEEYISEISRVIFCDWELLAIETLSVDKSIVQEIIKKFTSCKDQVKEVLHVWQNSVGKSARKSDLEEIINGSEIFKDHERLGLLDKSAREEPNDEDIHLSNNFSSNENGSEENTNVPSTFQELLKGLSKILGDTGVCRIHSDQLGEAPVEETLTTESVLRFLQHKNILEDEKESLKLFSFSLKKCLLFRASYLIDTYVGTKGKAKLITIDESVPVAPDSSSQKSQCSQESKADHESIEEQEHPEIQSSSENLEETNTEQAESEVT